MRSNIRENIFSLSLSPSQSFTISLFHLYTFSIFLQAIEEQYEQQYDKFFKKFSLSSQAAEIAELLDEEQDVSRYYAELVPAQVKPEEFWAR